MAAFNNQFSLVHSKNEQYWCYLNEKDLLIECGLGFKVAFNYTTRFMKDMKNIYDNHFNRMIEWATKCYILNSRQKATKKEIEEFRQKALKKAFEFAVDFNLKPMANINNQNNHNQPSNVQALSNHDNTQNIISNHVPTMPFINNQTKNNGITLNQVRNSINDQQNINPFSVQSINNQKYNNGVPFQEKSNHVPFQEKSNHGPFINDNHIQQNRNKEQNKSKEKEEEELDFNKIQFNDPNHLLDRTLPKNGRNINGVITSMTFKKKKNHHFQTLRKSEIKSKENKTQKSSDSNEISDDNTDSDDNTKSIQLLPNNRSRKRKFVHFNEDGTCLTNDKVMNIFFFFFCVYGTAI